MGLILRGLFFRILGGGLFPLFTHPTAPHVGGPPADTPQNIPETAGFSGAGPLEFCWFT